MKPKDTTTAKQFDKTGTQDSKQERTDLVESLMFSLQNSMGETLSSPLYEAKVDNVSNVLFSMTAYATSLKTAVEEINNSFSEDDELSDDLSEIADIADALIEGAARTTQYLDVARSFGPNLEAIQSELYSKLQNLHAGS